MEERWSKVLNVYANRSSYPDRKEGEDEEMDEELPDDRNLECDEDTLELTLPSGDSMTEFGIYFQRWTSEPLLL